MNWSDTRAFSDEYKENMRRLEKKHLLRVKQGLPRQPKPLRGPWHLFRKWFNRQQSETTAVVKRPKDVSAVSSERVGQRLRSSR